MKAKNKKEEQIAPQPQKGFEEFAIDPSVLDELDNLEDIVEVEAEPTTSTEETTTEEIEVVDQTPKKEEIIDPASTEFINIVRDNINLCAKEIKEVSETMQKIESQKGSESFWKKSENIKIISKHVNKMSEIQQKTLDLLVMFLGASGKMADDYDTILKTIDELGELNGGESEVLNYLLKVKRMIKEIKNNDERLKTITFNNEQLKTKVEMLEKNYKEKTTNYEKNSKIVVSKINRLNSRLHSQSFSILISYLLIIALGIVFYLKVFKGM